MAGILDLMGYIQDQSEKGRQAGLQRLVGKAYGAAPDQQQQILSTVAQRGAPDLAMSADKAFGEQQDNVHLQMAKRAAEVVALYQSNPQMAQQVYQNGLLPIARRAGVPNAPMQLDPSLIPGLEKLASAATIGSTAGGVQSTYIDAQGNRVAILRDGRTQVLGQNAPNYRPIDTGNGYFGFNPLNNTAQPTMIGGGQQQAPQADQQVAPQASIPANAGPMLDPTKDYPQLASIFPGTQVSSLYRSPEHNAEVGGVPNSQHMRGTAGDFVVPKAEQAQFIARARQMGYEPIQEGDHIHLELPPGRKAAASFAAGQQLPPAPNYQNGGQLRSAPKPEAAPAGYRYVGNRLEAIPGGPADPKMQAQVNDNGRNYVIATGPDGTVYRVNKLTGQGEAVQGVQGGGASLGGLNLKKDSLAVQKGTGANQIERGLQRLEAAVNTLSNNKFFDGGPLDQYALAPTKIGQEMEQATGSIMPALTALTRVPGVGSQSDWEGRLNMMQLPSVKYSPEVNKRAIAGLRQFINDLRQAYANVGIPFPMDANSGKSTAPAKSSQPSDDARRKALLDKY